MNKLDTWIRARWENLIAVQARDEEEERLGRLFNTLMVISTGISLTLSISLFLAYSLGILSPLFSWLATSLSGFFIPLSIFCLARARRGHIHQMVLFYAWFNMFAIGVAVWLFDGIISPAWSLFFWTIATAGILLSPASSLWMTGTVMLYFLLLLFLTGSGLYTPLFILNAAESEFVRMLTLLVMLVSTVGLLTFLNMRSLRKALRARSNQLLEAQEELLRKEKLAVLGQVAGSVGHELRNPLGVMSNAVYFLQTVLPDADASIKEYLNIIKEEIAVSERIVADLLDSVRTKPPRPEAADVRQLIEQTLRKITVPSSVIVKLDIADSLSPLWGDALQIHQVFRNLISNGIEAMPNGGTLEIEAVENKRDKSVTIGVRDTGVGMTEEQLGKLFQPLFTTKARGIGLGLIVVKNLTEANGGRVEVESHPGKGTMFSVTLPLEDRYRSEGKDQTGVVDAVVAAAIEPDKSKDGNLQP